MWTMNRAFVLFFTLFFYFVEMRAASNEREKMYKLNKYQVPSTFKCMLFIYTNLIKECVDAWTERSVHTVASFHVAWPLTNHSIHRSSTMFNLLDDTSNMFHFFGWSGIWFVHSYMHSFIHLFIFVCPFFWHFSRWRYLLAKKYTMSYNVHPTHSNMLACVLSVLFGNRYTIQ